MRKYCWVYKHKKTNEVVVVRRPHRREVNPKYSLKRFVRIHKEGGYFTYDEVDFKTLRAEYTYVGRLKEEVCPNQ